MGPRLLISIHAPREGSDDRRQHGQKVGCFISIHAPREGSDPPVRPLSWSTKPHFYPRSPRGERRAMLLAHPDRREF